jgi:Putative zinc-finger
MRQLLQPGQHLDPDQLSAFVEHALPEHERLATLAHISECPHCRQIVFLSQQAEQSTTPLPQPTPAWKRWFNSTPALTLAAASLACALVAVSLHLHHISQSPANPTKATLSSALSPTAELMIEPNQKSIEAATTPQAALEKPRPQPGTVPPASLFSTHAGKTSKQKTDTLNVAKSPDPQINGASFGAVAGGIGNANAAPLASQQQSIVAHNAALAPAPSTKALDQTASAATLSLLPTQTRSTNETVEVESASSQIPPTERTTGALFTVRTNVNAKKFAVAPLPSNLATVATISNGHQTLAADTAGTLYLSLDAGHHWTPVDQQWTGKAIQLSLVTPALSSASPPSQQHAAVHGALSESSPQTRKNTDAAPPLPATTASGFQLTTDSGAVWISPDGLIWKPR